MRLSSWLGGVTLAATLLAVPAHAVQGSAPASVSAADEAGTDPGRMVLVLDSSGSMKEPAAGGGTKIEAAKAALGQVVRGLPDEAEVGIRVFGAKVFDRSKPGACTDTQNVVPVGPLDREALTAAVTRYRPYGETPIGNALTGAAQDLGPAREGSRRTIVLLSDGEPTCRPDPCQVARRLKKQGVDVRINVVGLDVSGRARRALQCIARAGGGDYVDADSADELSSGLVKVSVRELRRFTITGTPVTGSESQEGAEVVAPGTYLDTSLPDDSGVAANKTARHYLVEKPRGGGVSVSALMRPPVDDESWASNVVVELVTPDGTSCARGYNLDFQVLGNQPIIAAAADFQDLGGDGDEECRQARELVAKVSSSGSPTRFQLRVAGYPRVTNVADLPTAVADPDRYVRTVGIPAAGPTTPVAGGVNFDDAVELGPGTTYLDSLRPGEQLLYKVPAGYGQAPRLSARVTADPQADRVLDAIGANVTLDAYSPLGQAIDASNGSAGNVQNSVLYDGRATQLLTRALPEVRLRNRDAYTGRVESVSRDGSYYFSLAMSGKGFTGGDRFQVPVRLRAEVVGDESGVPEYDGVPASGAASPSESPAESSEAMGDRKATPANAEEQNNWLPWVGGGVALVGALAVMGAVLQGRRRGRE